jgi:hypothetical protein
MNMCVVTTVAMGMLVRDFGPYGIIFRDKIESENVRKQLNTERMVEEIQE